MIEQMLAMQPTQEGAAAYEFERERVWVELLNLVAAVDNQLCGGHLRDGSGRVMRTLDEWVRAVQTEMERW